MLPDLARRLVRRAESIFRGSSPPKLKNSPTLRTDGRPTLRAVIAIYGRTAIPFFFFIYFFRSNDNTVTTQPRTASQPTSHSCGSATNGNLGLTMMGRSVKMGVRGEVEQRTQGVVRCCPVPTLSPKTSLPSVSTPLLGLQFAQNEDKNEI